MSALRSEGDVAIDLGITFFDTADTYGGTILSDLVASRGDGTLAATDSIGYVRAQLKIAGDIIAAKCGVPYLSGFELLGTNEDVTRVREGLRTFWQRQSRIPA